MSEIQAGCHIINGELIATYRVGDSVVGSGTGLASLVKRESYGRIGTVVELFPENGDDLMVKWRGDWDARSYRFEDVTPYPED